MNLLINVLIFYILSLVHVAEPQAQPCLLCGDAVLRIWSLMSRVGDRYLRITNDDDNNNHKIVDCAGGLQNDKFTSLLQIRDRTTIQEIRIQFVFARGNSRYHLYAPSADGELLAMPSNDGEQQTDNRNTWAPERLLYEHRLFTVFQSVKFRGYYLSCDGSGKAVLQQIINKAYREPTQLFLTIDPGNTIKGVTFGAGNAVGRRKREIPNEEDANPEARRFKSRSRARVSKHRFWRTRKQRPHKIPFWRLRPIPTTTKKPLTTQAPPKYSSVVTNFNLPLNITFVLCFWIKTETRHAQLISVTEQRPMERPTEKPEDKTEEPVERAWRKRYTSPKLTQEKTNEKANNIINVSILRGMLKLQIGYKRTTRTLTNCDINDGKFHQICISLNQEYLIEVYRDSKVVLRDSLPVVACDFKNKNNLRNRRGTLMLGRTRGMAGAIFDGSLFQVNLWDQYPSFRIKRIATNCACGGGTLVSWSDLLNGTMSNINLDNNSVCPKLEGYSYDELTQNKLI